MGQTSCLGQKNVTLAYQVYNVGLGEALALFPYMPVVCKDPLSEAAGQELVHQVLISESAQGS